MRIVYIIFLFLLNGHGQETLYLTDSNLAGFPGAVGHGKNAIGPQAPPPYFVTTTSNGTGAGTLYAAFNNASSPRTIIVRVDGIVNYNSSRYELRANTENVYYAGQTAPGDGLMVYNGGVRVFRSNQIIRHMVVYGGSAGEDCFRVVSSSDAEQLSGIIIDHVTGAYAEDEVLAVSFTDGVTISNSIIADGTGKGALLGSGTIDHRAENVTFYRNLQVWNEERNPRINSFSKVEVVNNFFHGTSGSYTSRQQAIFGWQSYVDVIGNKWQNDTGTGTGPNIELLNNDTSNGAIRPPSAIYHTDNLFDNGPAIVDSEWANYGVVHNTPQHGSGLNIIPAEQVLDTLVINVGAYARLPQGRDSYASKVVNDAATNVAWDYKNDGPPLPTYSSGTTPYADTDNDGLSDAYEIANGGNSTSTSWSDIPSIATLTDGRKIDQTGVTNWSSSAYNHGSIFLSELAKDWDILFNGPGPDPDPEPETPKGNKKGKQSAATNILNW